MKEGDIRKVVVVQSLEQTDKQEDIVSATRKREANHAAGAPIPKGASEEVQDRFLVNRAGEIIKQVQGDYHLSALWISASSEKQRLMPFSLILLISAATLGFFTNELGPEKRINILSFPLIGILAWNLAIYLRELITLLKRRSSLSGNWIEAFINFLTSPQHRTLENREDTPQSLIDAKSLFEHQWYQLQLPVRCAKLKSTLHFTALALAAGAIAGMYVNGIANEYRAIWESTFITDAGQLRALLQFILGPAATISGSELPSVEELKQLQWKSGSSEIAGDNAARWIHWYSITLLVFVLIPRLFLGTAWRVKSRRHSRTLEFKTLATGYYDHLLTISTGEAKQIQVVPYSTSITENLKRLATEALETTLKSPVKTAWLPSVAFGDEDTIPDSVSESELETALLFNFSATPESETHLALFKTLTHDRPNPVRFIILDTASFSEKAAGFSESSEHFEARFQAWKKMFAEEDVHFLPTASPEIASSVRDS